MYNIYGITDLPVTELKYLNRSWNFAPQLSNIKGAESSGFDKGQRAYLFSKKADKISFSLNGTEESPILNPCFVIKDWKSDRKARIRINGKKKDTSTSLKQGIIRDTDGTRTLVLWLEQSSEEETNITILQ
jgi:hypothetical protein